VATLPNCWNILRA